MDFFVDVPQNLKVIFLTRSNVFVKCFYVVYTYYLPSTYKVQGVHFKTLHILIKFTQKTHNFNNFMKLFIIKRIIQDLKIK